ncbi:MAG: efflux RND transporter permease subunit [Chloroflexota bacterium]
MRSIVGTGLRFRMLVLGLAATMMIFGVVQLGSIPVDALPEFAPPYVEVQTEALGLSAEEVEQLITVPLEADLLHGVAWLDEITSQSVPGLSSIVLLFEPGTDVLRARQMVAERLTQAHALPNVSKPPTMLQPLSSSSRVMLVGLSSQEVSLIDMSVLARWTMRPRLLGVPGVANVAIWGLRERQLQVLVDPDRLRHERVPLQQVIETAGNALWVSPLTYIEAATPGAGGFIDTANQRIGIQHTLPIRGPEDMARIPIEEKPGLVLGDVATIVVDHQPLIGDAVVNDGAGLFLVIEKFPDANTLAVTRGVEEALAALQPGLTGITVDSSVFRPADFIETAMGNMLLALAIGLLLVVVVTGLFIDWRAGITSLVTIPVSLMAALLVLAVTGATINVMIVAGLVLAIGVMVDDVVIGTGSVLRRFEEKRAEDQARSSVGLVVEAILEGRSTVVYATLIIALVVFPVAVVAGSIAAFLPQIAAAYVLAILASLVVALTVGPALASLLVARRPGERRESALSIRLRARYEAMLGAIVKRASGAIGLAGVVTVAVVIVFAAAAPGLGRSLVPQLQERDILIRMDGAPGTSRVEMNRIVGRAGAELRTIPGVQNVGAHVGRAITSDERGDTNAAEIWVNIDPAADYHAAMAAINEVVDGYPGLDRNVTTYSSERIAQVLASPDEDFAVRLYGQDPAVLRAQAEQVLEAVSRVDGVRAPVIDGVAERPTLDVEVDLEAAARNGLKPGDIRRQATSLLSGIEVGFLFEDQRVFQVVVWSKPEVRHSISSVGDVQIDSPTGTPVRLADVARVSVTATPNVIRREGVMRILDVKGFVDGRDFGAVMRDVQAGLDAIPFPLEYHAEVRTAAVDRQADQLRLLAAMLAAAIGVFLVLQASFGSWRLAAMTFATLPAALIGGLIAGYVAGGASFTLGAVVGLFTVFAIAVRNGIALISHYQDIDDISDDNTRVDLIVRGAGDRLIPIVVTALATAAAAAPFALMGGAAGFELLGPLAAVILGGLVSSTLVTLFVLPSVYLRSGPSAELESSPEPVERPALSPA